MPDMLSLLDMAEIMDKAGLAVVKEIHAAMGEAVEIVQARAKADMGHYQEDIDPFEDWAYLQQSTVDEKERFGFAPPDNPLLRTGTLRDHIEAQVDDGFDRHTIIGQVGVASEQIGDGTAQNPFRDIGDVAMWQELGTEHIPPRSFLGGAAVQTEDKVVDLIGESVAAQVAGVPVRRIR